VKIILLLLIPILGFSKTIELEFPELEHRVLVALPDDYNPAKKYPAILYYHGTNSKPDTDFILTQVDSREWIVVGMTYQQQGRFTLTPENLGKELSLLQSVRKHLEVKYNFDQNRCYIAGFSKGGWMTDMMLQMEPNLAGGVILGAGHMHELKSHRIAVPRKKTKRNVFIGIGRLDGNYPFGIKAVMYHRGKGSHTTFDPWHELKHELPRDGSTSLQQWFALQLYSAEKIQEVALREMQSELNDASELGGYEQWMRLRQLESYPYSQILGDDWKKNLNAKKLLLEEVNPVKTEAAFLSRHQKLLLREVREPSVKSFEAIRKEYQSLIEKAPSTKQADLARHDLKRIEELLVLFKKQQQARAVDTPNEITPDEPENKRRIPMNPLVK